MNISLPCLSVQQSEVALLKLLLSEAACCAAGCPVQRAVQLAVQLALRLFRIQLRMCIIAA